MILGCIAGGLLLLMILSGYIGKLSKTKTPQKSTPVVPKVDHGTCAEAWVMSQLYVNERLKAPATADYGWQNSDETTTDLGNGVYQVNAWVDSENSFGANVRTHYHCKMHHQVNDTWTITELNFLP